MGSHILAHVNIEWQDDRDPEFKTISELTLDSYEYVLYCTSSTHNKALYDLTLIKPTVIRFVGAGSF